MTIYQKYSRMSLEDLINVYTDYGVMGSNMDCSHNEWHVICEEMERRTPISFDYYHVEPIYDDDGTLCDREFIPVTRYEASHSWRLFGHYTKVAYNQNREIHCPVGVMNHCYWDDDRRCLVNVEPLDVDELPF